MDTLIIWCRQELENTGYVFVVTAGAMVRQAQIEGLAPRPEYVWLESSPGLVGGSSAAATVVTSQTTDAPVTGGEVPPSTIYYPPSPTLPPMDDPAPSPDPPPTLPPME